MEVRGWVPSNEALHFSIAGCGACTAVGLNAPSAAAAVRAGISGFAEHAFMVDQGGDRMVVATVPYVPEDLIGADRLGQLAVCAAREALLPLERAGMKSIRIPVVVGLPPLDRPGVANDVGNRVVEDIANAVRGKYELSHVDYVRGGHSAGLVAIETCLQQMRGEGAVFGLAGGVDSYLEPETLEWLEVQDQLHSGRNPWGFIPGEGAGFCLLVSDRVPIQDRLRGTFECLALGTSEERNLIKTDAVCTGEGLTTAIRKVLEALAPTTKVDHIFCDMNGEPYRADEYGFTVLRLSHRFANATAFIAPADCWGDVGAATGPLLIVLAEATAQRRHGQGQHMLIWTSSEDGVRAAALLRMPPQG